MVFERFLVVCEHTRKICVGGMSICHTNIIMTYVVKSW